MTIDKRITVAITGASGSPYALALLKALVARQQSIFLMISDAAREVLRLEMNISLANNPTEAQDFFRQYCNDEHGLITLLSSHDWSAPPASGSGAPHRMVICPCSMGTLAAVACGLSNNLIERAADVVIKERHRLIVLPREMPLSALHLENMLKLARLGVTVMPPCPAFYQQPQSVADMVNFVVDRVLTQLELAGTLPAWGC